MNNPYTYARVSLDAILRNLAFVKARLDKGTAVMAVVKSDAYGHGIVEVSKAIEKAGASGLGVAFTEEGVVLRRAGVRAPVFVLSGFQHGEEDYLLEYGLIPLIYDIGQADRLNRAAKKKGRRVDVHVKIDTGMGRLGFPYKDTAAFDRLLKTADNLNIAGIATHMSDAGGSPAFTRLQITRFNAVRAMLEASLRGRLTAHIANTDTLLRYPAAHFDMVRPGISLYGYGAPGLRPSLHVFSRLISIKTLAKGSYISYGRTLRLKRDTRTGVVPVGYADGYPRALSNKGFVGVRGRKARVLGRVTMNHIMIDLTHIGAGVGDRVLVMGKDGTMRIGADELASLGSTISYELLCGMGSNVRREYE